MENLVHVIIALVLMILWAISATDAADKAIWKELLTGKTYPVGKSVEQVFRVEDGCIVVRRNRVHLFTDERFKNFHFKTKIKTEPGANSRTYFRANYTEIRTVKLDAITYGPAIQRRPRSVLTAGGTHHTISTRSRW